MVPALTAGVSSYALFADPRHPGSAQPSRKHHSPTALGIVRNEIIRIVANSDGKLTLSFLGGLALSLWSANAGIKAVLEALNIVYGEVEKRSLLRLNAFSLMITVCGIAAVLLAVGGVVVLSLVFAMVGFPSLKLAIIAYLRWPAMLILAVVAFGILYRYGPSRRPVPARRITLESLTAPLL